METKLKLKYPVIVEGKYDKIKVSQVVSSPIFTLDGFAIFNNVEKKALLNRLSVKNGVILLTDSDRAGNFIRSKLKGILKGKIYNVYVPSISGKERRKLKASSDGLLGVEGIDSSIILAVLSPFAGEGVPIGADITKARFYEDGFCGNNSAAERRKRLAELLGLPKTLTANALIEAINLVVSDQEYTSAVKRVNNEQ